MKASLKILKTIYQTHKYLVSIAPIDFPFFGLRCITPQQQTVSNLNNLVNDITRQNLFNSPNNDTQNGLLLASKYQQEYTDTQVLLPSAPRTLVGIGFEGPFGVGVDLVFRVENFK